MYKFYFSNHIRMEKWLNIQLDLIMAPRLRVAYW